MLESADPRDVWGTEVFAVLVNGPLAAVSVTTKSGQDCFDDVYENDCGATVGDVEDCIDALAPDPCVLVEATPPECVPFLQCATADPAP